jgi:hypothetical protein
MGDQTDRHRGVKPASQSSTLARRKIACALDPLDLDSFVGEKQTPRQTYPVQALRITRTSRRLRVDGHSPNIPPSIAVDELYNRLGTASAPQPATWLAKASAKAQS